MLTNPVSPPPTESQFIHITDLEHRHRRGGYFDYRHVKGAPGERAVYIEFGKTGITLAEFLSQTTPDSTVD